MCVFTIARSSGSSGPGLLMISGGIADLADVVEHRDELGVEPRPRVHLELVADRTHEVEHVAAVCARVRVVGLDDVTEQERGASICARELERLIHPPLPLAARERDHEEQRERKEQRELVVQRADRRQQPERREREVDREDERHL